MILVVGATSPLLRILFFRIQNCRKKVKLLVKGAGAGRAEDTTPSVGVVSVMRSGDPDHEMTGIGYCFAEEISCPTWHQKQTELSSDSLVHVLMRTAQSDRFSEDAEWSKPGPMWSRDAR